MLDIAALLKELSLESPCGEDLEYDRLFGEMSRAAVGKPEQQFGDKIIPAEEPKWKEVQKHASELLTRTKDLRIVVELTRADLALEGFVAFCKDLELIRGYIERYWDTVHPQLDPDDGNDPLLRVNTLEAFSDEEKILRPLRLSPLVSSRKVGRYSLRDVAVADGELPPLPGAAETPDWAKINAAFEDTEVATIKESADAVHQAIENLTVTQRLFTERVGEGNGINLGALVTLLQTAEKVYVAQLARRGVRIEAEQPASDGTPADVAGEAAMLQQRLSGEITTRDDVLNALQKINDYYAKYEPSSPLPLLLQRCQRLVSASFLEIIEDLVPDALGKVTAVSGKKKEG